MRLVPKLFNEKLFNTQMKYALDNSEVLKARKKASIKHDYGILQTPDFAVSGDLHAAYLELKKRFDG